MKASFLAVAVLVCLTGPLVAQSVQEEPLVTDRPDFTESAETIAPGRVQLETGYTMIDEGEDTETEAWGEVLVRIGVSQRVELRLGLNSYLQTTRPGEDLSGFQDSSVGVKIKLRDTIEGSARPQVALLLGTTLPTGSSEYREPHARPGSALALAWCLSSRIGLGANLNYAYLSEEGEQFSELAGSVAIGYGLSKRLGGYLEYFGFNSPSRSGPDSHFLDGGFTWLLSNNAQLDARAGVGLNSAAADFFVGVGAAWRW
ncbi:MAG: transporter [Thermoanaerobaculia bacterium]